MNLLNASSGKHLFFLYTPLIDTLPSCNKGTTITLHSKELAHRLSTVLRLRAGELVQLFSQKQVITITLAQSARPKDTVTGTVVAHELTGAPPRNLVAAIGFLKKESFEEAVHHASVAGATVIIPLITEKSRKSWAHNHEQARLEGIVVAACEQSKNRHMPALTPPQKLPDLLAAKRDGLQVFFEAGGPPLISLLNYTQQQQPALITLFFGPEGGLTAAELALLIAAQAIPCALTPTILRTQEAVCVGLGALASIAP